MTGRRMASLDAICRYWCSWCSAENVQQLLDRGVDEETAIRLVPHSDEVWCKPGCTSHSQEGFDWLSAAEICWACWKTRPLKRAHLQAHSLGGSGEASNLILLCGPCHQEFDMVFVGRPEDREAQLKWVHAHFTWNDEFELAIRRAREEEESLV